MPARSKRQQRFFGLVRAAQKGRLDNPSADVAEAARSMSVQDVKDFAATSHDRLPEAVDKQASSPVFRVQEPGNSLGCPPTASDASEPVTFCTMNQTPPVADLSAQIAAYAGTVLDQLGAEKTAEAVDFVSDLVKAGHAHQLPISDIDRLVKQAVLGLLPEPQPSADDFYVHGLLSKAAEYGLTMNDVLMLKEAFGGLGESAARAQRMAAGDPEAAVMPNLLADESRAAASAWRKLFANTESDPEGAVAANLDNNASGQLFKSPGVSMDPADPSPANQALLQDLLDIRKAPSGSPAIPSTVAGPSPSLLARLKDLIAANPELAGAGAGGLAGAGAGALLSGQADEDSPLSDPRLAAALGGVGGAGLGAGAGWLADYLANRKTGEALSKEAGPLLSAVDAVGRIGSASKARTIQGASWLKNLVRQNPKTSVGLGLGGAAAGGYGLTQLGDDETSRLTRIMETLRNNPELTGAGVGGLAGAGLGGYLSHQLEDPDDPDSVGPALAAALGGVGGAGLGAGAGWLADYLANRKTGEAKAENVRLSKVADEAFNARLQEHLQEATGGVRKEAMSGIGKVLLGAGLGGGAVYTAPQAGDIVRDLASALPSARANNSAGAFGPSTIAQLNMLLKNHPELTGAGLGAGAGASVGALMADKLDLTPTQAAALGALTGGGGGAGLAYLLGKDK